MFQQKFGPVKTDPNKKIDFRPSTPEITPPPVFEQKTIEPPTVQKPAGQIDFRPASPTSPTISRVPRTIPVPEEEPSTLRRVWDWASTPYFGLKKEDPVTQAAREQFAEEHPIMSKFTGFAEGAFTPLNVAFMGLGGAGTVARLAGMTRAYKLARAGEMALSAPLIYEGAENVKEGHPILGGIEMAGGALGMKAGVSAFRRPPKPKFTPPKLTQLPLPEGWTAKVGETNQVGQIRMPAQLDWPTKSIIVERAANLTDPQFMNHEIAHIKVRELPKETQNQLVSDYVGIKGKSPEWQRYGADKMVRRGFHREELAMDLGNYFSNPELVSPELRAIFDKSFPAAPKMEPPIPIPKVEPPTKEAHVPGGGMSIQSPMNPVERLKRSIAESKVLEPAQAGLYAQERAQKFAAAGKVKGEGVERTAKFMSKLRGSLSRVRMTPLTLGPEDLNELHDMIHTSNLDIPQRARAITALNKLTEGSLLQPNERVLMENLFGEDLFAGYHGPIGFQKLPKVDIRKGPIAELLNLPRALQTMWDVSWGWRQGIGMVHTREWRGSWPTAIKAIGSEAYYQNKMREILNHPDFKGLLTSSGKYKPSWAEESGLQLTDLTDLAKREEVIQSSWAEKVPLARASFRAFTLAGNEVRAGAFSRLLDLAEASGKKSREDLSLARHIARYVNDATGRAELKTFGKSAEILNGMLFSPRLMKSRLNMFNELLNPVTYFKTPWFVKKQYLKSMAAITGQWFTIAALAKLAGADVNLDLTNADFGKIKIGNTRIDPAGGFQQYLVLMARLANWGYTSSASGKFHKYGGSFGTKTAADAVVEFLKNKVAPVPGAVWGYLDQTKYRPYNVKDRAVRMFIPMFLQDMAEIAQDDPNLLPLGLLGAIGMGVQTYDKKGGDNPILPFLAKLAGKDDPEMILAGLPFLMYRSKTGLKRVLHGTPTAYEHFNPKLYDREDVLGWMTHFAEDPEYADSWARGMMKGKDIPVELRRPNIKAAVPEAKNVLDLVDPNADDMAAALAALDPRDRRELIEIFKQTRKYARENPDDVADYFLSPRHYEERSLVPPSEVPVRRLAEAIRFNEESFKRSPFDAIRYRDVGKRSWAIPTETPVKTPWGVDISPEDLPKPLQVIKGSEGKGGVAKLTEHGAIQHEQTTTRIWERVARGEMTIEEANAATSATLESFGRKTPKQDELIAAYTALNQTGANQYIKGITYQELFKLSVSDKLQLIKEAKSKVPKYFGKALDELIDPRLNPYEAQIRADKKKSSLPLSTWDELYETGQISKAEYEKWKSAKPPGIPPPKLPGNKPSVWNLSVAKVGKSAPDYAVGMIGDAVKAGKITEYAAIKMIYALTNNPKIKLGELAAMVVKNYDHNIWKNLSMGDKLKIIKSALDEEPTTFKNLLDIFDELSPPK